MSAAQMMCRSCGLSPGLCDCVAVPVPVPVAPKRNGAETRLPTPLPPVSKNPGRVDPVVLPRDSSASDAGVERRVLGAIVFDPERLASVRLQIGADAFTIPWHRMIFAAMEGLADAGRPLNLLTLVEKTRDVVPIAEVTRLDLEPTAAYLPTHVGQLKAKALRRKLGAVAQELRDFDDTTPPEELAEIARRGLTEIATARAPGEKSPLALAIANSSVSRFRAAAPARDWIVEGLIPARQTGLIVATGGTGKGHWLQQLGCAMSSALPLGPFRVPRRAGMLYLSLEDDSDELHRRFDAAKAAFWISGVPAEEEANLERYFHQVDLVGLGAHMGPELVELIAAKVAEIPDCALVVIDPLTLAAPEMAEGFNDQKGAQRIHAAINEIRQRCGVSVMCAHHTSKGADPMDSNAATGSRQLVDLSRFVINLSSLEPSEVLERGLDPREQYVEAATTKINAAARMSESAVWRRASTGALRHLPTKRRGEVAEQVALSILPRIEPATEALWEAECLKEKIGQKPFRDAKKALVESGIVRLIPGKRGAKATKDLFEVNRGGVSVNLRQNS